MWLSNQLTETTTFLYIICTSLAPVLLRMLKTSTELIDSHVIKLQIYKVLFTIWIYFGKWSVNFNLTALNLAHPSPTLIRKHPAFSLPLYAGYNNLYKDLIT